MLIRPLVSVHRLVLLFPDMYRLLDQGGDTTYQRGAKQVDEQRRGVFYGLLPTLPLPTKAPVEAETSTIINEGCFSKEFHSELRKYCVVKLSLFTVAYLSG